MRRLNSHRVGVEARNLLQQEDWTGLRNLLAANGSARDAGKILRGAWLQAHTGFLTSAMERDPVMKVQVAEVLAGSGPPQPLSEDSLASLPHDLVATFENGDGKAFAEAIHHHRLDSEGACLLRGLIDSWLGVRLRRHMPCLISLDSIQFNHDLASHTADALNIRRNRTVSVGLPEWRQGMTDAEDAPAAYSLEDIAGHEVTIKVRVGVAPWASRVVQIRAEGGGVLGHIDPFRVKLSAGLSLAHEVTLRHIALTVVGRWDITWDWEYSCDGELWYRLGTTHHRIYAVLRTPHEPWQSMPLGTDQNPWTEALDLATQLWPGHQADATDSAAEGICSMLNPGGVAANPFRIRYSVEDTAAQHYDTEAGFNLSALLERARGGEGAGPDVNCDDCAGLVVSLANILGCDLWERRFDTQGMRPVMPLGYGQWWLGAVGFIDSYGDRGPGLLFYHTVAWRGDDPSSAKVFDIAYLVNGFEDPDNPEQPDPEARIIYYPYGVRFQEAGVLDYIEQLHPGAGWLLYPRGRRALR